MRIAVIGAGGIGGILRRGASQVRGGRHLRGARRASRCHARERFKDRR